jgi:hypothetical protein
MRARFAGLLLLGLLIAAGCGADPNREAGRLQSFETFDAFPLYAPGDSFGDLELELVRRRPGYIEFRYAAEPPLRVEVWPGCVRTPLLRQGVLVEGESYERTIVVRRATAYAFDAGRRLEVPLEGATVVVRAHTRRVAREAAGALKGVNNPLTREDPLPGVDPEHTTAGCSVFDAEAPLIEARLEEALGLQGPHLLRCGRSLSVARTDGIDDAHDCFAGTAGGEPSFWCVLSRGKELVADAMAQSCEAAVLAGAVARPLSETETLAWGARAGSLCEPHLARVPEVIAGIDQERAVHDLSHVWEVMGAYEAELVADLRSVRVSSLEVEEVLARYEARIEAIRAAVDRYHSGQERKALADLEGIESETPELVARLTSLGAPQCAPPW